MMLPTSAKYQNNHGQLVSQNSQSGTDAMFLVAGAIVKSVPHWLI